MQVHIDFQPEALVQAQALEGDGFLSALSSLRSSFIQRPLLVSHCLQVWKSRQQHLWISGQCSAKVNSQEELCSAAALLRGVALWANKAQTRA